MIRSLNSQFRRFKKSQQCNTGPVVKAALGYVTSWKIARIESKQSHLKPGNKESLGRLHLLVL
jgi:hypothetical protein